MTVLLQRTTAPVISACSCSLLKKEFEGKLSSSKGTELGCGQSNFSRELGKESALGNICWSGEFFVAPANGANLVGRFSCFALQGLKCDNWSFGVKLVGEEALFLLW